MYKVFKLVLILLLSLIIDSHSVIYLPFSTNNLYQRLKVSDVILNQILVTLRLSQQGTIHNNYNNYT